MASVSTNGGNGFLLKSDGSVVPAQPVTYAAGVLPHATPACVTAGAAPIGIDIPLDHALGAKRWFGLVSYESSTTVTVHQSGGDVVRITKGIGTLITNFPPTALSFVGWGVPAGHSLCITGLRIVLPRALTAKAP